jgi:dual oxidase
LREKLELVFEMCDRDNDGRVNRAEFFQFVRSLNIAAGVRLESELQECLIETVLHRSGIDVKQQYLTYKHFEAIFSHVDDIRRPMGVHMRGAKLKINLEE